MVDLGGWGTQEGIFCGLYGLLGGKHRPREGKLAGILEMENVAA
jgi:hypothetical protein